MVSARRAPSVGLLIRGHDMCARGDAYPSGLLRWPSPIGNDPALARQPHGSARAFVSGRARSRWPSLAARISEAGETPSIGGEAMPYPEADHLAAIKASLTKFEEQISALTDDPSSRRQCRAAANELMIVLQALVNRLRE